MVDTRSEALHDCHNLYTCTHSSTIMRQKTKGDFYNIKLRQYRSIYLTGKETEMHPYLFIGPDKLE